MIFIKRHQLTFHDIPKILETQFSTLTGLKLFTSFLLSEPLSNGVTTARFALFGKVDVFKLWFIIWVKNLYIYLAVQLTFPRQYFLEVSRFLLPQLL